jgi:hypothetical protein
VERPLEPEPEKLYKVFLVERGAFDGNVVEERADPSSQAPTDIYAVFFRNKGWG